MRGAASDVIKMLVVARSAVVGGGQYDHVDGRALFLRFGEKLGLARLYRLTIPL